MTQNVVNNWCLTCKIRLFCPSYGLAAWCSKAPPALTLPNRLEVQSVPTKTMRLSHARRKLIGASLPATLLLWGTLGAQASYVGASGYVAEAHVGNRCAAVLITPQYGSPTGGVWFSIDTSSSSPLTAQAASAQIGILLGAANAENLAVLAGQTPTKLGLDYDPAQIITCNYDAEGDTIIQGFAARNFNYPPAASQ